MILATSWHITYLAVTPGSSNLISVDPVLKWCDWLEANLTGPEGSHRPQGV